MESKPRARRAADFWISLALLAAVAAVYWQARDFGFVNYDDPDYVAANPHVREGLTARNLAWAFSSTADANWFPLTRISHLADGQMFAMWAGGHHLTSVLIHAAAALLLFAVMKRATGARWPSAFVAFVFAIHPLHVESVAWVAERKDVLSAVFWMLTLWAYEKYRERPGEARYAAMALLFACALMSKPMAVTLPAVLLLIDYWRGRPPSRTLVMEKLPLFAMAAASAAITYVVQRRAGSVANLEQIPLGARMANAVWSYVVYLFQFIWPSKLAVFYPYPAAIPLGSAIAAGAALLVITILVVRRGAPRYLAAGWLWYLITLLPVIGLIQVGVQSRADRYTYIPLIGVSILVGFGAADLVRRWPRWKLAIAGVLGLACAAWTIAAVAQAGYWQNSITLFEHAVEVTEGNYVAYENLGNGLREAGRTAAAIADFERAVAIKPGFAEGQNNLGQALMAQGQVEQAIPHILEAVRLEPKSPEAHLNLGTAFRRRRMLDESEAQFRAAIALAPENVDALCGLATVLGEKGRADEAIAEYREALRVRPDDADTHYNLALLLAAMHRPSEAIAQFSGAIRLQPESADAHFNLGNALAEAGEFERAADEFQAAVRIQPDYGRAHFNLASALANLGRYRDAAAEFQAVLRIDPDFPDARRNFEASRELARQSQK